MGPKLRNKPYKQITEKKIQELIRNASLKQASQQFGNTVIYVYFNGDETYIEASEQKVQGRIQDIIKLDTI